MIKHDKTRKRSRTLRRLIKFLSKPAVEANSINFTAHLDERTIPVALAGLLPRMAKTQCVGMHNSLLMQSNYENQGLPIGVMHVYNAGLPHQAPRMLHDLVALVFCTYGGADCNIVGEGPLHFRPGRYYFTRVKNDHNECAFHAGLSSYYYLLLPDWLLEQLLGEEEFRDSGVLAILYDASVRSTTTLVDEPHQVITEPMGHLLNDLRRLPVTGPALEQALLRKTMDLLKMALRQARNGNAHVPEATGIFRELCGEAEEQYVREIRRAARRARFPAWALWLWDQLVGVSERR